MSTSSAGLSGSLPPRPNVEFYRKQAKALLKAVRRGDAAAVARVRSRVPRLAGAGASEEREARLHDAQLTVAREAGFASWPALRAGLGGGRPFRTHVADVAWYEQRVAGVLSVHRAGLAEAIETVRANHPGFAGASDAEIRSAALTADDARLVLAREHGFETWAELVAHVEAVRTGRKKEPFSAAFEAIRAGDDAALGTLLRENPDLVEAQGTNGSSLLNLSVSLKRAGMCRMLLDAGAEVDLATTRGVTPLHAAAYGNAPELIEMLVEAGASLEACAYGDGGTPLVMALFWGHDEAREALAQREVVPANLRAAAGVGRMDLVRVCFGAGGALAAGALEHRAFYRPHTGFPVWTPSESRQEVLDEALTYAARNGQVGAMEFLIGAGADINGDPYRGTALAWAVWKGSADVVRWLLDHGADVNRRGTFGGPRHGEGVTALHLAAEAGRRGVVELLLERGADAEIKEAVYGGTPAGWAEYNGHREVSELLAGRGAGG